MIKLYNTLTKQVDPLDDKKNINMYTCGPTVYNHAHIGNLRSFIVADLLYRTLKFDGRKVQWAMNITDIDDKTIKGTIEKHGKDATVEHLKEFTTVYFDEFVKDLREVNVSVDDIAFYRITDHIQEIQEFVVGLMGKGYAYKADDGSVYFSIEKYQKDFGDYGHLVGEKFLEGKKVGARVKVDEYEKDNLSDFALWKAWDEQDAQIFWDHPTLGKGRPGWHIECSVINKVAFNGEPTDIHTGGVDLIFPHHTNEIAQSQALLGKGNFVKHWLHSEHLLVDGKKMSKSAGNFYTLESLREITPHIASYLRYLFTEAHYSSPQNYTETNLRAIQSAINKLSIGIAGVESIKGTENENIIESLRGGSAPQNQNLNISEVRSLMWKAYEDIQDLKQRKFAIEFINQILGYTFIIPGVKPSPEVEKLAAAREQARSDKDFEKSDELRKKIEDQGYEVMDTAEGQKVRRKISI